MEEKITLKEAKEFEESFRRGTSELSRLIFYLEEKDEDKANAYKQRFFSLLDEINSKRQG